ncbi:hypothetical protein [Flavobacterium croceum]|uniref:hypothetical protein n=1 Tax=Flavobacterium croceum TaxID=370975 RepID=UPI0024A9A61C|nr:hypothetical protein [Flavobacterium croceum]
MGHLFQKLFLALGGFARWVYFMFMNLVFDKKHEKHIGYYLFEEEGLDNRGMDTNKKNFVVGIFMFIFILLLIQYFE